ncbi:putative phospholipase B-like lamina ancestor [Adelges cooleyi]|uniref:putative phospholipase B-like lamina ancestor n=1 Tax=Adelges cooleyi TaxID=133065 RepID=UPI00217F8868|nr:putative phospholipase B-like lamina ancestor [Adelges cooleyi]XP_050427484.1 putative phospholipase B-like lamina ancestor [Adelges cooleyi]XP_050427489.1 putative phospholipase B-like lamina ancestor [Adelges cooleyi]XP_050427495.1 putative phospholipase B-like lamina ancestor [Adelges cooleyi]
MLKVVGASWAQTQLSWCLIVTITMLGLLAFYFGGSIRDENDGNYAATVFWTREAGMRISFWGQNNNPEKIRKGVARAYYRPGLFENGWAVLEIETQHNYPDTVQAMAAGYLEGSLSWQMIHWHWQNTVENTCVGRKRFCERTRKFLEENTKEVKRLAEKHDQDPFWHQVNLFYTQLKALEEGWRQGVKRSRQDIDIPSIDFLWMNIVPDLKDFERKLNSSKDLNPDRPALSVALLKITDVDPFDYVLASSASGYYGSMLRIKKRYDFGYRIKGNENSPVVNGKIIEFTSYPGTIFSQDDFYRITQTMSNTESTVVGTQIQNNNRVLWEKIMKPEQVLMGARVMAANRLAVDGKTWSEIFTARNSGTGNKQWLVLNSNNVSTEFWVVEQLPDFTCSEDMTQELLSKGYWVSSSYPYHPEILRLSNNERDNESPDHPVANVLHRGQQNVTDVQSMVDLMRGPDMSLIGRSDLLGIKTNTMFRHFWNQSIVRQWAAASAAVVAADDNRLRRRPEAETRLKRGRTTIIVDAELPAAAPVAVDKNFAGIVDLKVAAARTRGFLAAAGPPFTADRTKVEPFRWSDSPIRHLPHHGHPDVWAYDLADTEWAWSGGPADTDD